MDAFIRSDQYHYIKNQAHILLNGHMTSNDSSVKQALKSMTCEKVLEQFSKLTDDEAQLVAQVQEVQDETDAILYFSRLKQYVTPFPTLYEDQIKALFPKAKKLKVPSIGEGDWKEMSYIGWNEPGTNRKYIVTYVDNELIGIEGHYTTSRHKNICTICHEQEKVGLFTSTIKGKTSDETISRGNYICHDSKKCNENIQSRDNLEAFIKRMKG
ncbi:FusB/FusC family EF-G-binding protein [Halobacillus litoralis]|uniref:FusB/FusC family EF-G-binding protein n=1 Tax=Halobacillus litoralis TaxID=45668 RepID=UPI001CFCE1E0|nr:FusB/FusC family EF-G-binding protein [Halobacillus litoralis]